MVDRLMFGKAEVDRIVSIEVADSSAYLFRELADGSVDTIEVPNRFWILSSSNPGDWHRLKGEQYYRWGRQYESRAEFLEDRKNLKKWGYDIFSIYDPREALCVKDGYSYFRGMRIEEVSILSFDIEATSLDPDDPDAKVLIIANTFRRGEKIIRKMFCYDEYANEGDMISAWCAWARGVNPAIMCGHHINGYDLRYLRIRAQKFGGKLFLGRDASEAVFETWDSKFRKDQTQDLTYRKCRIYGREIVDTMFGAIKYDMVEKKYVSHALKKIVEQEGWEVPGRQHYEADKIRFNYKIPEEWTKIKKYAEFDADDSLTLFDKHTPSQFYLAQYVPKSFQLITESASGSMINSMMLRGYLQDEGSLPKADPIGVYQGAISFGIPGIYSNVFKVDVKSMYPSIMLHYDVFNVKKDPQKNLRAMLEYFLRMRLEYKKKAKETGDTYYKDLDNSAKIFINSTYGFYNAAGLNFNHTEGAAEVTRRGREILQQALVWASGKTYDEWYTSSEEEDDAA